MNKKYKLKKIASIFIDLDWEAETFHCHEQKQKRICVSLYADSTSLSNTDSTRIQAEEKDIIVDGHMIIIHVCSSEMT